MAYERRRPDFGAERRRRRDLRRESGAAAGFDEKALYRDILAAQGAIAAESAKLGEEATEATLGAGVIETDKLGSALGRPAGFAEKLRGAMSVGAADALSFSKARRDQRMLEDLGSVGTQMVEKESAKASRKAEKKARQASEAGTFLSGLAGLGGLAASAGSALPGLFPAVAATGGAPAIAAGGPAALPLLGVGLGLSALGSIGQAATHGARGDAQRELSKIAGQAASFEQPSTKGIEDVLASGSGYGGFESSFLGGQEQRRRRRRGIDTPYSDALADLSFIGGQ